MNVNFNKNVVIGRFLRTSDIHTTAHQSLKLQTPSRAFRLTETERLRANTKRCSVVVNTSVLYLAEPVFESRASLNEIFVIFLSLSR